MSNAGPENPIASALTEGLKRKRGRPKKQPQEVGGNTAVVPQDAVEQPVKKPRGRPKGSKKVPDVTGASAEPAAAKRGRGRPRKWPQAVVQEGESQESSDLNLNLAPATQVSSGAPAPISLPATEMCADISGATGSRGMSSPPAQPLPPLLQLNIAPNRSQHHWKRRIQIRQNSWC